MNKLLRIETVTNYIGRNEQFPIYVVLCASCNKNEIELWENPEISNYSHICDDCTEIEQNKQTREQFDYLIGAQIIDLVIEYGYVDEIVIVTRDGIEHTISVVIENEEN